MKLTKHVLSAAIGSVLALGATSAMAAAGLGLEGDIGQGDGWTNADGFDSGCPALSPFPPGDAICSYGGDRTIPSEILIGGFYDFPLDPDETTPNGNSGFAGTPISGGNPSVGGNNYIRYVPDTQLIEGDEITFTLMNGQFCGRAFMMLPESALQQPNVDPASFNSSDSDREDVLLAATETSPTDACRDVVKVRIGDDLNIDRGTQLILTDEDISCNDCNSGEIDSPDIYNMNPVIRVQQGLEAGDVVTIRASASRSGPTQDFEFAFAGPAIVVDVEDQFSLAVQADTATIDVFALIVNDNTQPGGKGFDPIEDVDDNSIPRRRFDDEYDLNNGCSDDPEVVGGNDVLECDYNSDSTDLERSAAELTFNNNSNGVIDDYIILQETGADHEFEIYTTSNLASNPLGQVDVPDSFVELEDTRFNDPNFNLMSSGASLTTGACGGLNNGVDADNLPDEGSSFTDDFVIGVNATNEDFSDEIIQAREWFGDMILCIDGSPSNGTDSPNSRTGADFDFFDVDPLTHRWINNSIVLESVYVNLNSDFNNRFIFHNTAMNTGVGSENADAEIVGANCRNENGGGLDLVDDFLPLTIPADSTVVFFAPDLIDIDALTGGVRGNSGPLNRASCTFFIAGGNDEIQGTSQVIQAGVGAITDSPMLRPGTN